jgi:hypothetical protein
MYIDSPLVKMGGSRAFYVFRIEDSGTYTGTFWPVCLSVCEIELLRCRAFIFVMCAVDRLLYTKDLILSIFGRLVILITDNNPKIIFMIL